MTRYTLGISSSHNSSAALLDDQGRLVFALQEERLSRLKNHWALPEASICEAFKFIGGGWELIDEIVFGGIVHPATRNNIDREQIMRSARSLVDDKLSVKERIGRLRQILMMKWNREQWFDRNVRLFRQRHLSVLHEAFPQTRDMPAYFVRHHDAHFGSACFGSPWAGKENFLAFTCDGQGDGHSGTVHRVMADGKIETLCEIADNDSLATLYAWTTLYLGFIIFEHEYKLMGMAPYAEGKRGQDIARRLGELYEMSDGQWRIAGCSRVADLYEAAFFRKLQEIYAFARFDDICAGVQLFVEDFLCRWVGHWIEKTGIKRIACSGGIFMNVKANMRLMQLDAVEDVFVFPSCGDETNSIGALYFRYHQRTGKAPIPMADLGLGRSFAPDEVDAALQSFLASNPGRYTAERCADVEKSIAGLLAQGEVVARFEGREEFGARALGRRSLLANPSDWTVIERINEMIKKRDFWMPFACTMLDSCASDYIENPKNIAADYMIMCFPGRDAARKAVAGTHPRDHTIRAQVLRREFNPSFYKILELFRDSTGIGAILNTSLNVHGYPLAGSPEDAFWVLHNSGLKYLAIDDLLVVKQAD